MDERVEVLFRPWAASPPQHVAGDTVLFLGARRHPDLVDLAPAHLHLVQPYVPWRDDLGLLLPTVTLAGATVTVTGDDVDLPTGVAAALVLPPRAREQGLAWIGRAWRALRPGGELVVCAPTREGGKRYAEDVLELDPAAEVDTKARCRVARAVRRGDAGLDLAETWAGLDAPAPVLDGQYVSRPGVFGWDKVDAGSAILASVLPPDLGPVVVDAGCGYGWLGVQAVRRSRRVSTLHLLEADERALACAVGNLARLAPGVDVVAHACDATQRWPVGEVDDVVMNPPFHETGRADPSLGQAFLQRAAAALRPGGRLFLVANRQLPYERPLQQALGHFEVPADRGGFKVLVARRR